MNPWDEISDYGPYVLDDDKPYVDAFNKVCTNEKKRINLNHPPEPRLGPTNAPVLILQSNPSYEIHESGGPANKEVLTESLRSLFDEGRPHKGALASSGWWAPRLNELRAEVGGGPLSRSLLSVEFFPYRTLHFGHGEIRLPSQWYTFSLVREAVRRDAIIIVARNWKLWVAAIPELFFRLNVTVFRTKSPRSTYFSRNNMGKNAYDAVVKAIQHH